MLRLRLRPYYEGWSASLTLCAPYQVTLASGVWRARQGSSSISGDEAWGMRECRLICSNSK